MAPVLTEPLTPASATEVADVLVAADGPVVAIGSGALAGRVGLVDGTRTVLSTRRLDTVLEHRPDDQVVTVGAGLPVASLDGVLAAVAQECPLDPWWPDATVGGAVIAGLNGFRRIGRGPIRDLVLGIEAVTGDGDVIRAGGRTVKNVTGYDLCRLLVGSLGRWAVLTEVTLRAQPRPEAARWYRVPDDATRVPVRPSSHLVTRDGGLVLMEGAAEELEAWERRTGAEPARDADVDAALAPVRARGARLGRSPPRRRAHRRAAGRRGLDGRAPLRPRPPGRPRRRRRGARAPLRRRPPRPVGSHRARRRRALDAAVGAAFDARGVLDWRRR